MEQGSTSLSTSTCNGYGKSTLLSMHARSFRELFVKNIRRCLVRLEKLNKNSFPRHFKRLIFEAIKQCEGKDVKGVELSEEFFTSKWPPRRFVDAFVVSTAVLLSFVYLYLIGYIDKGGSKAGSSGSLEFRDIYISILLFRAAYIWIKFRDVIPRGAVYHRRDSNKFEPRIKFPVTRGVGEKSKRIPLGLYDTFAEGSIAYQIASFYCNKRKHTGRLDLGGGAYFPIPALNMDPNLRYEEKVKQVGDQVLKVYADFEEQKTSRNLPSSVHGLPFEMPIGEGHLLSTSPIHQLRQRVDSRMDLSTQCLGSHLSPNTHNGADFNNPSFLLRLHAETQHQLLDAYKQIECLKAQVSQTEVENMGWEVKYSELSKKFSELEQKKWELEQKKWELEHGNGLLNREIMQLQSEEERWSSDQRE